MYVYFLFTTCFGQPCAHHQENKLYQCDTWFMPLCVDDGLVGRLGWNLHTRRSSARSDKYQVSHWYSLFSWWRAHGCPKHVENRNKRTWKICSSIWFIYKEVNQPLTVLSGPNALTWHINKAAGVTNQVTPANAQFHNLYIISVALLQRVSA